MSHEYKKYVSGADLVDNDAKGLLNRLEISQEFSSCMELVDTTGIMSRIDLRPSVCNLCGGKVLYVSNRVIYGREYGSGKCYYCTECGAYVGTHVPRPEEAFGILADERMREMKKRCHALFDEKWKNEPTSKRRHLARVNAYAMLAEMLAIPLEKCHFGYFDLDMLHKAYEILQSL